MKLREVHRQAAREGLVTSRPAQQQQQQSRAAAQPKADDEWATVSSQRKGLRMPTARAAPTAATATAAPKSAFGAMRELGQKDKEKKKREDKKEDKKAARETEPVCDAKPVEALDATALAKILSELATHCCAEEVCAQLEGLTSDLVPALMLSMLDLRANARTAGLQGLARLGCSIVPGVEAFLSGETYEDAKVDLPVLAAVLRDNLLPGLPAQDRDRLAALL